MRFEWDARKEQANREKHGVSFDTALLVFNDPNRAVIQDRIDERTGEQRWQAIGQASLDDQVILLVVHVNRSDNGEEIIHIISARKANKRERRLYFE